MANQEPGQESFGRARGAIGRVRSRAASALGRLPAAFDAASGRARGMADQLPATVGIVREGARGTARRLQTLPDSGLRLLAAVSVGVGAGLRIGGRNRLAAIAGFLPASIFGLAIVSRPHPRSARSDVKPLRP